MSLQRLILSARGRSNTATTSSSSGSHTLPPYRQNPSRPPTYVAEDEGSSEPDMEAESVLTLSTVPSISSFEPWRGSVTARSEITYAPTSGPPRGSSAGSDSSSLNYIFYRLYTRDGAVTSKNAFESDDPHLGRILATVVPPPHTVSSLKRCISKAEDIQNASELNLFEKLTSTEPMEDNHISLFMDTSPGVQSDKPMAMVFDLGNNRSEEDFQNMLSGPSPFPKYPKKLRARQSCQNSDMNPKFLDFKKNETLYTDGKSRWEMFAGSGGGRSSAHRIKVFWAVNSTGMKGFVMKGLA